MGFEPTKNNGLSMEWDSNPRDQVLQTCALITLPSVHFYFQNSRFENDNSDRLSEDFLVDYRY